MDIIIANLPWYVSRATAVAAYLLMFFIILIGTGMTTGFIYRISDPLKTWVIHQYLAIAFAVMVLIHAFSLMLDRFINFKLKDILIPWASSFKPTYLSLGIIGFYIILILVSTSIFWRLRYARAWQGIHFLSYILFPLIFFHAIFTGTDSGNPAMKAVYWPTGLIFVFLLVYRFHLYFKK